MPNVVPSFLKIFSRCISSGAKEKALEAGTGGLIGNYALRALGWWKAGSSRKQRCN
jgi:hypothetical protein